MAPKYQQRTFLTLIDDKESALSKQILESPLGLANEVIRIICENDFEKLKNNLDNIKKFVAGISRAEQVFKSTGYKLASYYSYMFAFHQFFNSSFRARQGKALEKIIITIISQYTTCEIVPEKPKKMLAEFKKIFTPTLSLPNLDIDALGIDKKHKKAILIQLRSRDDTGGTTAKESLVDLLRAILRNEGENNTDYQILYLVCVWDRRDERQKKSTISKMFSSLKDLITVFEENFSKNIFTGVKVREKITLKLAYGTDEIINSIFTWCGKQDKSILSSINNTINYVQNWDDLWIAYAISNLELETKYIRGKSNCEILDEVLKKIGVSFDFSLYSNLVKSIDEMTTLIVPLWNENTIPLLTPSDQAHYIRDLLFLKACYTKKVGKHGTTKIV